MLYICVPAYNEASTIGVLLWRLRKVFQEYSREYEVIVYDDGSTDDTAAVLASYGKVVPLTVVPAERRGGYGSALDSLCRLAARRTRYPRRDAMIVLQADFTEQPEIIPELVRRFEGGADIVAAARDRTALPVPVRRLAWLGSIAVRPFVTAGVEDPFASFRLYRVALLRDYQKAHPGAPFVTTDGWAASLELLVRLTQLARRVETVTVSPRYDLRTRATRVRPWPDALALYRSARRARGWRRVPGRAAAGTEA